MSKAAKTKQFILEKVAPVFNRNGYADTSMADITEITGLTKGAIYGNYKNKEELALASFNYNIHFVLDRLKIILEEIDSPLAKLYALTNFYRTDIQRELDAGGCPVLTVGIDTNHTNPELFARVKSIVLKLQNSITKMITEGQKIGEIKKTVTAKSYGSIIFSLIEGSIFTSMLLNDKNHLIEMMNHLDLIIKNELKK